MTAPTDVGGSGFAQIELFASVLDEVAERSSTARSVLFLTGSGISAESGLIWTWYNERRALPAALTESVDVSLRAPAATVVPEIVAAL